MLKEPCRVYLSPTSLGTTTVSAQNTGRTPSSLSVPPASRIPWVFVPPALALAEAITVRYVDSSLANAPVLTLPCKNPETSGLLSDTPYRNQYGSNAQNVQRPVYQPDPESLRREREALEGICHAMSE